MERREKRARLYVKGLLGDLANALRYAQAMQRARGKRLQNKKVDPEIRPFLHQLRLAAYQSLLPPIYGIAGSRQSLLRNHSICLLYSI